MHTTNKIHVCSVMQCHKNITYHLGQNPISYLVINFEDPFTHFVQQMNFRLRKFAVCFGYLLICEADTFYKGSVFLESHDVLHIYIYSHVFIKVNSN